MSEADSNAPSSDAPNEATLASEADATVDLGSQNEPTVVALPTADEPARVRPSVPGYEILEELGRGGMGVVYRARQVGLNRIVALKMILSGAHAGDVAIGRFRIEAEAVARLLHPNIVQIYEIGEVDRLPYFSLEYVEGGALDRRLSGAPMKPAAAAALIATLARAIHAAHRAGVVHRDLKPGNILIAADGTPKISDFGLAKRLDSKEGNTQSGSVLGSPSYMAPEQASGQTKLIGPLADVYSLGAILYELLVGRPPFRAATPLDTVMQVVTSEPVPPSRLQPGLPRDLETICLKCLQKEPGRRYPDAQALADDIGRFLSGEPIIARPAGAVLRMAKWVRRRPAVAALTAAVLMVATVGFAGVVWQWKRAERQKDRAEQQKERAERQKLRAEDQRAKALSLSALAQRETERAEKALSSLETEKAKEDAQLYAAHVALAQQEWFANNVSRARELLAESPTSYRGWEWNYLSNLCQADKLTLRGHGNWVMRVRYSADGKSIATLSTDQTARLWNAETGVLLKTVSTRGDLIGISPGADIAATADGSKVLLWDLQRSRPARELVTVQERQDTEGAPPNRGQPAGIFTFPGVFASGAAFRPDGRRLAVGGTDRAVHIWDLETAKELVVLREHGAVPASVAYSADGKVVATASATLAPGTQKRRAEKSLGEIRIWDAESGKLIRSWEAAGFGMHRLAFASDGQRLAGAGFDGVIHLWDSRNGRHLAAFAGHRGYIYGLAFSPDGSRLASGSWDRSVKLWDAATGRELATFRGHEQYLMDVAFSPDGREVASCGLDATAKTWDLEPLDVASVGARSPADSGPNVSAVATEFTQEFTRLSGHEAPVQAVAFSPDGTRIATGGWEGTIRISDVRARRTLRIFSGHSTAISTAAFSPDGKRVLSASGGSVGLGVGEVKIWDPDTGHEELTVHGGVGSVSAARFSPDGTRIVSAIGGLSNPGFGQIRVWDAADGRQLAQMEQVNGAVMDVTYSPDGRTIASVGFNRGVRFWDPSTGKETRSVLETNLPFRGVAYSRDGAMIAAVAFNGPIFVWESRTGRELWRFPGHNLGPSAVTFHPSGRRLASVGADGSAKIWDLTNGLELLALRHHNHEVYGIAFDPEGRLLATAGFDTVVRLYSSSKNPLPKTRDWPIRFADDFNGTNLGDRWSTKAGRWSVEDGALRGVLEPVDGDIEQAAINLRGVELPRTVEIRFECWSPGPMVFEAKLVDEPKRLGLLALLVGDAHPSLNDGKLGGLLLVRNPDYGTVASNTSLAFEAGKHYAIRVVREPKQLTLLIDDVVIVSSPVPDLDVPQLLLQGSWAKAGSVLYFDNVQVRAPRSGN